MSRHDPRPSRNPPLVAPVHGLAGVVSWGILWRENSRLDGKREMLIGCASIVCPRELSGYTTIAFKTRSEARGYIKMRFGYIAKRSDLRAEPYGWKMPRVVKINIRVTPA
jgi:hypothetical protein